jgi:Flp pilus assembly protein TadD
VLLKMKATALGNMGYVRFGTGQLSDAATSFQAALQLDHHGIREWQGLGLVEQESGDMAGALRAFSELARIDATDVNLLLLAQALEKNGQMNEARDARQKAAALSSNLDAAQRKVDRLLSR